MNYGLFPSYGPTIPTSGTCTNNNKGSEPLNIIKLYNLWDLILSVYNTFLTSTLTVNKKENTSLPYDSY